MKAENAVAQACKISATVLWILGFIVGIVVGGRAGSAFITGYFWGGSFAGGLFFYAFGELLNLLEEIKNKMGSETTSDAPVIKEKQNTERNTFFLSSGTYRVGKVILPNVKYDLMVIEGDGQIIVNTNGSKLAIDSNMYNNLILKPNSTLTIPEGMNVKFEMRNSFVESLLVKGEEINT